MHVEKPTIETFFENTPAFIVAFQQIIQQGFFEWLNVETNSGEGRCPRVSIRATGYVPDDQKDMHRGVTAFIDPNAVIETVRKMGGEGYGFSSNPYCKIEQSSWPKYNRDGTQVIGRRGEKIFLEMSVALKWKGKDNPPN